MVKGTATYRILSDHLGSPRLVVDAVTGEVAQRMDYDAWGNVLSDTNPGFQPFGFAGGLLDPTTGWVRMGARDYDPRAGRWTTRDPLFHLGDHLHLYAYVRNDPVNLIDPSGLYSIGFSFFKGIGGGAAIHWTPEGIAVCAKAGLGLGGGPELGLSTELPEDSVDLEISLGLPDYPGRITQEWGKKYDLLRDCWKKVDVGYNRSLSKQEIPDGKTIPKPKFKLEAFAGISACKRF